MTNALFVSGGVKKIGSLRNIQLKRNGRLVTSLDLYDLLLHGDTSGDRQLLPGRRHFHSAHRQHGVGRRRGAASGDLRAQEREKTVAQAIEIAGGLMPDADAKIGPAGANFAVALARNAQHRFDHDEGARYRVANGDKLTIPAIRPTLENSVVLIGLCVSAGQIRISPRTAAHRCAGQLRRVAAECGSALHHDPARSAARRKDRRAFRGLAACTRARGSAADPELRPRDKIYVFDLSVGSRAHIGANHPRVAAAGNAGKSRSRSSASTAG